MTTHAAQPKLEEFAALSVPDLLARYARGVEHFPRHVLALTDDQLDTAFLPSAECGKWPVRVLVGHLADAELAFVHRFRRVVAEDGPVFSVWDEDAFIDSKVYGDAATPKEKRQSVGAFIATIFTLRKWMTEWLRALDASAWERKGMHPQRGEQTLKLILVYATWHLEHHAWYLARKMDKFAKA